MSDGPHRSLQKRTAWKKVAEVSDNRAFAKEEIAQRVAAALAHDWRIDVARNISDCICDVLGGQKDSLFQNQKTMQLEALRPLTAGRELAQLLLECAIRRATGGETGVNAAEKAAVEALEIWGARNGRQIEEHYRRESTDRRANNVRDRIEQVISSAHYTALARELLRLEPKTTPRIPPKQSGLDDGVRL